MTIGLSRIFSGLTYRFARSIHTGTIATLFVAAALASLGWSNTVQAAIVSFAGTDADLDYTHTSITRTSSGRTFTFAGGVAAGGLGIDPTSFTTDGLYAYQGTAGGNDIRLTISIESGYTFDISQFDVGVSTGSLTIALTYGDDSTTSFTQSGLSTASFGTLSSFSTPINDVKQVVLTSADFGLFQNFSITDVKPNIVVAPASLPAATVASAYSQTISASGGTAPYSFAVTAGSLPTGLSLNSSTGGLLGTPSAGGTFNFTVTATDGNTDTGSRAYSLTVNDPTITITPNFPPNFTVGSAYSQAFTANGGTATYTYAITAGSLPAGITLSSGGLLSGTPTAGGTFNFTITATDSSTGTGPYTGSHAYTLVANAPTITLSPASLPAATVASSYSQSISASGGTSSYSFAVTAGSLPAGLTLASNGSLSGTPTAGGTFNFTVTATDSSTGTGPFTGSRAYSLTVNTPTISLSPTSLPAATVAVSYSQSISASGGTSSYTFAVTAGALPTGLTLASNGSLSGTPTADGIFNFTITATDSSTGTGPYTGSRAYSLTVMANPPVVTTSGGARS